MKEILFHSRNYVENIIPPGKENQPVTINFISHFLARRCEERGILFLPVPSRLQEGKQVYRCGEQDGGSLLLYIDRNAIFVLNKESGMWIPTSLNTLLDDCMKMKV